MVNEYNAFCPQGICKIFINFKIMSYQNQIELDVEKLWIWTKLHFKNNLNVIVGIKQEWCYILDVEFDPTFENNEVTFYTFWDIKEELLDTDQDEFFKEK